MKEKWKLSTISDCRGILFGILTLMIVIFHTKVDFLPLCSHGIVGSLAYYALTGIKKIGDIGVDLFALLSGMGLYFSFSKNKNLRSFYRKRAMRVLPAFFIVALIWCAIKEEIGAVEYIKYVLQVRFFKGESFEFWFIPYLLFCYLIFPLLYKGIEKHGWVGFVAEIVAVVTAHILLNLIFPAVAEHINIATSRVPAFIVGILFGKLIYEKKEISKKWFFVFGALFFVLFAIEEYDILWNGYRLLTPFSLNRLLYCPLAVCIMVLLSAFISKVPLKGLYRFFSWVGLYSLEVYLLYEKVRDKMEGIFTVSGAFGLAYMIVCFVMTMVLAILLKYICDTVSKGVFAQEK